MSTIGYGYGSEWHLLRYLGYHRQGLNAAILRVVGGGTIRWLDCPFHPKARFLDSEWKGLDFLEQHHPARTAWSSFWPGQGNVQNWDAVGRLQVEGAEQWLLVEAKGHLGEIKSTCGAKPAGGLDQINQALETTRKAMGIEESGSWLGPYYQLANRLATIHHLLAHGVEVQLVNIYFLGDTNSSGVCPEQEDEWRIELNTMYQHLGVGKQSTYMDRVHAIYLPVCPGGVNHPLTKTPAYSPQPKGTQ